MREVMVGAEGAEDCCCCGFCSGRCWEGSPANAGGAREADRGGGNCDGSTGETGEADFTEATEGAGFASSFGGAGGGAASFFGGAAGGAPSKLKGRR